MLIDELLNLFDITYNYTNKNTAKPINTKKKYRGIVDEIKEVRYNGPAIIVFWKNGDKTTSVCHKDDVYDYEKGLAMCILKFLLGDGSFNEVFRDFAPEQSNNTTKDIDNKNTENRKIIENLLNTKKLTDNQKNAIKSLL